MKPEIKQGIENSRAFFVLGTKNYFKDTECLQQAEYAKSLGKSFKIALEKDAVIPKEFLKGVEDYQIEKFEYNNEKSIKEACERLLGKFNEKSI